MSLGKIVKEKRLEAGKTIEEVANALNVTKAYISLLEKDRINPPRESKLEILADFLGLDRDRVILLAEKIPSKIKEAFEENPHYLPLFRTVHSLNKDGFDRVLEFASKQPPKEGTDDTQS